MKKYIILFLFFFLISCEDVHENEIVFQGITFTDADCRNIGEVDLTDWTYDNDWLKSEIDLFDQYKNNFKYENMDTSIRVSPVCPNPCYHIFSFKYKQNYLPLISLKNTQQNGITEVYRIVNQNFERLASFEEFSNGSGNNIIISSKNLGLISNEIFRMYYAFFYHDTCIYKGHGDILTILE